MQPDKGKTYKRLYGSKDVVTVEAVTPDGYVKFKDIDGMHFVRVESFNSFFEKVENKNEN